MENYFEYKGVWFGKDTPTDLCDKLLELLENKERVVLDYGDTKTKQSWGEVYDITGRVGKSTGTKPILLLVYNKRSLGGGAILTNCILSIKTSKGKNEIYKLK